MQLGCRLDAFDLDLDFASLQEPTPLLERVDALMVYIMTLHLNNEKHPVYYRHDDKPIKHPKTHKVLPDVPTQIYNIRNRQVTH